MNKLILFMLVAFLAASCATTKEVPLYNWGSYSQDYYKYLKNNTPESQETLIATLNTIIEDQSKTTRQVPPPGVCGDLGFLLVQQGKVDEGIAFLEKEKEYYPESAQLINTLIKRIKEN